MKTKMLYEIVVHPIPGTGSPDYFHNKGSTELPFATLSKDSPLEQARQTGRISKALSSSRVYTLVYWIYFTSLIRSNKLKINFNDNSMFQRELPDFLVRKQLQKISAKLGENFNTSSEFLLSVLER